MFITKQSSKIEGHVYCFIFEEEKILSKLMQKYKN